LARVVDLNLVPVAVLRQARSDKLYADFPVPQYSEALHEMSRPVRKDPSSD